MSVNIYNLTKNREISTTLSKHIDIEYYLILNSILLPFNFKICGL